ncbi:hypothetical protein [Marinicrinis lubricantis]|uniref:Uncharacterized protein n=1 Tax=Marinicrinis lubricantis TaxID=2086470 RepID=A0ABW1IWI0_9BACL
MHISNKQESAYLSARSWTVDWKQMTQSVQADAKQQQISGLGSEPPSFRSPSTRG